MGLFLAMSCIVDADEAEVTEALAKYAAAKDGSFSQKELRMDADGCLVASQDTGGVTILYPWGFCDWDDASAYLSGELQKAVFSFHIHDDDLWMYVLYEKGAVVDQFNPIPDYWGELGDSEKASWRGNADKVAQRVPGLQASEIARYLVFWDDMLEAESPAKAYPDDHYRYCDDWQLVDFMGKLGFCYPLDDHGSPHGTTFRFEVPESKR